MPSLPPLERDTWIGYSHVGLAGRWRELAGTETTIASLAELLRHPDDRLRITEDAVFDLLSEPPWSVRMSGERVPTGPIRARAAAILDEADRRRAGTGGNWRPRVQAAGR